MTIEVTGFRPGVAEARAERRREWAKAGLQSPLTIPQAIAAGLKTNKGVLAVHTDTGLAEITARQLHEEARRMAGALRRAGAEPGDVIAMQMPNWVETTILTLAIFYAGGVVLPVVPIYGPKELAFILRQSRAKFLFVPERWGKTDYLDTLGKLGDLPHLKTVVMLGNPTPPGGMNWRDLRAMDDPDFQPHEGDPTEICHLLYTSGTTADPKGVLHSHQTLLAFMNDDGPPNRARSGLLTPQTGHIGQIIQLLTLMYLGDTVATMERWSAEVAAQLIAKYKSTRMGGAPVFLYTMLDAAKRLGLDVSSIWQVMLGSTAIMPSDIENWSKLGIVGFRCYGSTEHALATGKWPHENPRIRAYTDGYPSRGTIVRIVDNDGRDAPTGQPGEVVLLGPQQFIGYFDPALNADNFMDGGWFLTGDIGVLDADGALTITDRKKDIIIRGGENISAKEVEDTLARLPWVVEPAVVAMPDEKMGEKVCAFLIARDPPADPLAAVRAHFAAEGVARPKTPERIEIVPDFPRTPTGKIKKYELRQGLKDEAKAKAAG
jgi:acyl-CoA synthetase (AMP-forming)/AMP-acid ligase II